MADILKILTTHNCSSNGDLSLCQILCLYHYPFRSYLKMLNFWHIVKAILKMATGRNFSMSGINLGHHYLPTYQILMISDNVEFLCRVLAVILKMTDILKILTMQNCSSKDDISLCQILCFYHYPFRSYLTMLNFCCNVVAILKMATGRNFSMSGINLGYHYLSTYQILVISDNVEFWPPNFMPCFGSHFENGRHLENFDNT
jgi:hypothetical protein